MDFKRRRLLALAALALARPAGAAPERLPAAVEAALAQARVPREALAAVVQEAGSARAHLSWQAERAVNPASLTKLLTTFAALELLGPAWQWRTPVWLQGPLREGVLDGDLVIKGSGDPKLVQERVWLLLRRVQSLGVREIRGDLVLDRSAFAVPETSAADFDGEAQRPYNVRPDALLLNYKSLQLSLRPEPRGTSARVTSEPPLAGLTVDAAVPLSAAPCEDWRSALKADLSDPARVRLTGAYPAACGERDWPLAYAEPASYNARLLEAAWRELGGRLGGRVREGVAPAALPSFEFASPPLAEVVREINKYSNNVMAQQLFLTLGLQRAGAGTPETGREALRAWLVGRFGAAAGDVVLDNGSGLSRETRLSAGLLARLLQAAWASPLMPELFASLPLAGIDGTLTRLRAGTGRAHLKTGSLRDVIGLAGVVEGEAGRRWVLVAIVNHANAQAARPALEALVQWTAQQGARP